MDVNTTENKRKYVKFSTQSLAATAMLSAIAFVLMYIEVTVPFMPFFIKFDFSDLPALLGAFAMGPIAGVVIELIKNLLHLFVSQSMFIGELSNFILGAAFVVPAGIIYGRNKNKKNALSACLAGAVFMGLLSIVSNYFVVYPVYYTFMPEEVVLQAYQVILPSMKSIMQCLLVFNLPFTIGKGLIDAVIAMLIYKPLSPILKGRVFHS